MATVLNPNLAGDTQAGYQQKQASLFQQGLNQAGNAMQKGQEIDQKNRQMVWDMVQRMAAENPLGLAGVAMNDESKKILGSVFQQAFKMTPDAANAAVQGLATRILNGEETTTLAQHTILTGQNVYRTNEQTPPLYNPLAMEYAPPPPPPPPPPDKQDTTVIDNGKTDTTEEQVQLNPPVQQVPSGQKNQYGKQTVMFSPNEIKYMRSYVISKLPKNPTPEQQLAYDNAMAFLEYQDYLLSLPENKALVDNLNKGIADPMRAGSAQQYASQLGSAIIDPNNSSSAASSFSNGFNQVATNDKEQKVFAGFQGLSYEQFLQMKLNEATKQMETGNPDAIRQAAENRRRYLKYLNTPNIYLGYKTGVVTSNGDVGANAGSSPNTQNWTNVNGTWVQTTRQNPNVIGSPAPYNNQQGDQLQYSPNMVSPQAMNPLAMQSLQQMAAMAQQGSLANRNLPQQPVAQTPAQAGGVYAQGRFIPGMTPDAGPSVAGPDPNMMMAQQLAEQQAQQLALQQAQQQAPAPSQPAMNPLATARLEQAAKEQVQANFANTKPAPDLSGINSQLQAAATNIQQGGTGQVQPSAPTAQPVATQSVNPNVPTVIVDGKAKLDTTPIDGTSAAQTPQKVSISYRGGTLTFASQEAADRFNAMTPAEQAYNLMQNAQTANLLTPAEKRQGEAFMQNLTNTAVKTNTRFVSNYQGKLSQDILDTVAYGLNLVQPANGKVEDNPVLAPLFYNATDAAKRKAEAEIENTLANAFANRAQGAYYLKQAEYLPYEFAVRYNASLVDKAAAQNEALAKLLPKLKEDLDPYYAGLKEIYVKYKDSKDLTAMVNNYHARAMESPSFRSAYETAMAVTASLSAGFLGMSPGTIQKSRKRGPWGALILPDGNVDTFFLRVLSGLSGGDQQMSEEEARQMLMDLLTQAQQTDFSPRGDRQ